MGGVWKFIIWEKVVQLVYLLRTEARGNPDILLQCTSRVIIRGWVSLEVVHQLGDGLFHLQRHGCHNMLLYTNRFSGHRYSYWGNRQGVRREAEKWRLKLIKNWEEDMKHRRKKLECFYYSYLVFQVICGMCRLRFCNGKQQVHQIWKKRILWNILFCQTHSRVFKSHASGMWQMLSPSVSRSHAAQTMLTQKQQQINR